ncbi:MAG: calcium/sodium antiporter [Nitrospiria bacterium]
MIIHLLWLLLGLILLTVGADVLVSGASNLARRFGVSPLVVGLTIVALGTSAPEMAVGVFSSLGGQSDVAVGNVVGSNISNICLALGLAALIRPLKVQMRLVRFEVPLLIALSASLFIFGSIGEISRWNGVLLFTGLLAYILLLYRWSKVERPEIEAEYSEGLTDQDGLLLNNGKIIIGFTFLVLGADFLVDGGVGLARYAGVSELIIGLTVIAIGTSLPEMATSLLAVWRNKDDIAIGNVLGSNIFNLLGVLGASAIAQPLPMRPDLLVRDLPLMGGLSLLLFPLLRTGFVLKRWEGILLLAIYTAYIYLLFVF